MTARKLRLREAAIATTRFFMETRTVTKPVLMEIKAFLMADATFTKNVLKANTTARKPRLREATIATTRFFMETKVATKPFLVANTTARKTRLKEALIEAINLAKPVIREIKNFLIEVRIFEKNAVMEVRIVKIPVLIEPRSFLMAVNSIRGKENDAREGPAATTIFSGFY